jgi:NitT/TauT family transport system substrate-binding protein
MGDSLKHVRPASVLATAAALVACGCSSNGATTSLTDAGQPVSITIAAVPSADLSGVYIALDQGLFTREGLDVNLESIASSKAIISAQLKGKIDLCAGAYLPYITDEAAGDKFSILAEGSVMTTGTRLLLAPKTSDIDSVASLEGKTIGMNATNSIGTLLVSAVLEENGVSPKSVKFETDPKGFPTMGGELADNKWDAAFFGEPYATAAEEDYGEQTVVDLDQGATEGLPISGYIATSKWAAANPDAVSRFVTAIEEAQTIADTDRPAVEQALQKYDHLSPLVTSAMNLPDFPVGTVDSARIQREADDMVEFGMIPAKAQKAVEDGAVVNAMIDGSR